jgi:hypothetical protein
MRVADFLQETFKVSVQANAQLAAGRLPLVLHIWHLVAPSKNGAPHTAALVCVPRYPDTRALGPSAFVPRQHPRAARATAWPALPLALASPDALPQWLRHGWGGAQAGTGLQAAPEQLQIGQGGLQGWLELGQGCANPLAKGPCTAAQCSA